MKPSAEPDPLAELAASIRLQRQLAAKARADLESSIEVLVKAIGCGSGQAAKIERLVWSIWNDDHPVRLCDCFCGLDTNLGIAVLAMIAARIHLGGDADDLLRRIIDESGSQPPPD